MIKNKYIFWFILAVIPFILLGVDKRDLDTATDVLMWESIKDEALSISGNYDSGIDSIGISVTSDVTPRTIDISGNLRAGYKVKLFTIYSDQDVVVKIYGDGINAFHDLGYITSMVRGGKTATWEFNNLTSIQLLKPSAGATNPTVDFYLRCIRDRYTLEN